MWFKQRKLNLPPGPAPWPIMGSIHLLGTHPHKSLADLARKYGPVMSIQLGQKFCVVAASPEAAKEFLKICLGRDPAAWEKPLEFMPGRFLDGAPHAKTQFQGQHFELIPFGSGRRQCPGMAFGSIAARLQAASLLHAFDWSFLGGMAPEKLDMTEGRGLSLQMLNPLVAVAKPRLPSHLYQR